MVIVILLAVLMVGCSNPTGPTRTTTVPAAPETVTTPPVATPPPVSTPAPIPTTPPPVAFPPNDARFDLTFYRMFVHNALDRPVYALFRQEQAPRIYMRTVDDDGRAIDAATLNATAAALEDVTGKLTGVFGLASLTRGTGPAPAGSVEVSWGAQANQFCGTGTVGGLALRLYPRTLGCRCSGHPSAISPLIVKHEMGHILGFWHTDNLNDLMKAGGHTACDMQPSAREIYHAALAYTRPVGSASP